jgi:hypothetical protein
MCEKASRQHSNLLSATQTTMEGHWQRGGNAIRHERCPRGSPLPSHADNTIFDTSFTRQLYPEVPDYTTPPSLPSDATEEHILWLLSPHLYGLTTQQARCRLTSLLCEMWRQEPAPFADPQPELYAAVDDAWIAYAKDSSHPYPRPAMYLPPAMILAFL